VDGSVYQDLAVGLRNACACQAKAFFGALQIFFWSPDGRSHAV